MLAAAVEARLNSRPTRDEAERVVVAVKVERVMSKDALAWALSHVVRAGDCVTLLAVFSDDKSGKRFWSLPMLTGDCASSHRESLRDRICQISETCSRMVLQCHNQVEVKVRIKLVSGATGNAAAVEARRNRANWVILDKKLKQELKHCMEELRCNIVVMKRSQAKVLRLNLQSSDDPETPFFSAVSSPIRDIGRLPLQRVKHCTPVSSPERPSTSQSRTTQEDSVSSSDTVLSPILVYEQNPLFEEPSRGNYALADSPNLVDEQLVTLDTYGEKVITLSRRRTSADANTNKRVFWIQQNHLADEKPIRNQTSSDNVRSVAPKTLLDKFVQYDAAARTDKPEPKQNDGKDYITKSSFQNTIHSRTSSTPPPLCSICQNKAPIFGKPPKQFSYAELQEATDRFSDINLLAEGGFGIVYRGVLRDGQAIAVKLLKFGGPQADTDFCREVRVLSCAQHRNVVLLIGFCVEGKKRILVYEYICNMSLDFHLHGTKQKALDWDSRLKIAIGTARGLRYLHEDCRVGCIMHRDMRPHNILLTHDFEPLVADFGLARWYSGCGTGAEERVIGTSGYLAPEYVDSGPITQKVDVYAFGLVLLELITGRRPTELHHYKEQNLLVDWLHPLGSVEQSHFLADIYRLLDSRIASDNRHSFINQLQAIGIAASLCLNRDPESRPSMSKVLRILEGGILSVPLSFDLSSAGNRSGRLLGLNSRKEPEFRRGHSRRLSH